MPTRFGKYTLHQRIGRGGMAEVYLGTVEGAGGFEKQVAIKRILPPYGEDREIVRMFMDEARIVGRLSHPNVAQVFEFDEVDGVWYLAMEYVRGRSLSEVLRTADRRSDPLPIPLALHTAMEVCKGLYAAHSATDPKGRPMHVVHRDISPHNVQISYSGHVKILDFGVAKARDKLVKTEAGIIRGKLLYMSPEQVRAKPLDHRADVYSLGLVIYKAVTEVHPFKADSDVGVMAKLRKGLVPPPSRIAPHLPKELDAILMKALATRPEDRYDDVADLHDDLAQILHSGWPGTTWRTLERYMRRLFAEEIKREEARGLPPTKLIRIEDVQEQDSDWDGDAGYGGSVPTAVGMEHLEVSDDSLPPGIGGVEPSRPDATTSARRRQVALGGLAARGVLRVPMVLIAPDGGVPTTATTGAQPGPDTGGAAAVPIPPAPGAPPSGDVGWVWVTSLPAGAEVHVDGRVLRLGGGRPVVTPATVGPLPAGDHRLELTIPGYVPWEGAVAVTRKGRAEAHADLRLTPGVLSVTSTPPGAQVLLDGEPRGATPVTLEGLDRAHEHVLRLELDGHASDERAIVFEGERVESVVTLEKAVASAGRVRGPRAGRRRAGAAARRKSGAPGFLSLNAIPWARIYVDGQDTGQSTPAPKLPVSAGEHVVLLVNPTAGHRRTFKVTVEPGKTVRRSVDFRETP